MRDHFLDLFAYDRWANTLWLNHLLGREAGHHEWEQMAHLLGSQRIWVSRVEGVSPKRFVLPKPTFRTLEDVNGRWVRAISELDHAEVIHYHRTTGQAERLTLAQIAAHSINHSTYHRGVLRGMALVENRWDFPDTDLAVFHNLRALE